MPRFGIASAMTDEIEEIKKCLEKQKNERIATREFYSGEWHNKHIVLTSTKEGKVAAASAITTLIQKYRVNAIIYIGVAGAVGQDIEQGDIVIAEKLCQHDFDASKIANGKYERGEIPALHIKYFPCHREYYDLAVSLGPKIIKRLKEEINVPFPNLQVVTGPIISGDQFIASNYRKGILRKKFGAQCVDMESAAVAQVCHENSIPLIVVRMISEKADNTAGIEFTKFLMDYASASLKVIAEELVKEIRL